MALLEVRHLSVGFRMYRSFYQRVLGFAVDDLSLTAEPGQVLGIVGASGSGKSLLAHAIMGLLPYNAVERGEIWFDGELVTRQRVKQLRRSELALIPQSISFLDPLKKVGDQLYENRSLSATERVEVADRLGLVPTDLDKYPFQLSGGMARRILLATALLSQARLIIADEPTPGLPVTLAEQMLADFRTLANEGRCVLIISHDVDLVSAGADQVAIVNRGRLVAQLSVHDFTHPDDCDSHPYAKALWRALPQNDFGTDLTALDEEQAC